MAPAKLSAFSSKADLIDATAESALADVYEVDAQARYGVATERAAKQSG